MNEDVLKHNIQVLQQLARQMVGERFKRMARDEVLSKFMSLQIDPALFVDLQLQVEREAIHLTEISLLTLVTPDRLQREIQKAARQLQQGFQNVYGEENQVMKDFLSQSLVQMRESCLRARVDFYNPFLSQTEKAANPLQFAVSAYNRAEKFSKKLEGIIEADRRYNEELIRQTETMHRFLMKKQSEIELLKSEELWAEFQEEAFKTPAALP